jgi:hypothetical protein
MRSFVVTQNGSTIYANGFLDLQPLTYDDNYDGLPDAFQRKYFSLWTGTNAAPNADPDRDGFSNVQEYVAGTSPTNGNSRLRIESIRQTVSGAEVTWQSGAGSKYMVLSKAALPLTAWQTNAIVVGNAGTTTYLDTAANGSSKFYRVVATP